MFLPSEKARRLENAVSLVKEMTRLSSDISQLAREQYYEASSLIKLVKDIQTSEVKFKVEQLTHRTFDRASTNNQSTLPYHYHSNQSLSLEKHQLEEKIQQIESNKADLIKQADELAHEIREVWIAITCDS